VRREPALTFQGALAILGHHERPIVDKLDKLLGGVILGAGLAGAPIGALWGWVDQKNEASGLLRKALDAVSDRLLRTAGYERHQLIAAAHTAIVVGAYFEAVRAELGERAFDQLEITDEEKRSLVLRQLYTHEVPAPSPATGFVENSKRVSFWMNEFNVALRRFVGGLAAAVPLSLQVVEAGCARYHSHYLRLAAAVPEFLVWASLGEHAATRTAVEGVRADVLAALDDRVGGALGRIETVLNLVAGARPPVDLCAVVERANRALLDQPVVPVDAERYGGIVTFPTLGRIYVDPRYRIARAGDDVRPANEFWWDTVPSHEDLDLMLAAHVTSPDATRLPLLLLGHPGAGKSMLTKVLAARLPASTYTVIRVPLRTVGANAPIVAQIEEALRLATNNRPVEWWSLAEQSRGTLRVVLLDGLDELLQASTSDRSGYLQEVVEFQRIEAEQGPPVIVVVTSRTIVADRVAIPPGTTLVKLDPFDAPQISRWLAGWRDANAAGIEDGWVRALTLDAALRQGDLACQPLLLLMLALYCADPATTGLDGELSTTDLYGRLLDNFARREVMRRGPYRGAELETRVEEQLDRLAVAALGMFNRKRLDISEADLGADLVALGRTASPERLIAEFFFVHAAEARTVSAHRTYEFLHFTFEEYVLASRVVEALRDVAEQAYGGRRERDPRDDLLFALLSHEPLSASSAALGYAAELFGKLAAIERQRVHRVLEALLAAYRNRHATDQYAAYRPQPVDQVRQLAAYSANLVLLRVIVREDAFDPLPLVQLLGEADEDAALEQWRSTVTLWRAGLDESGWQSVLSELQLRRGGVRRAVPSEWESLDLLTDFRYAQLIGDAALESRLRYGLAVRDDKVYWDVGDDWATMMSSWLVAAIARRRVGQHLVKPPPRGTSDEDIVSVAELVIALLRVPPPGFDLTPVVRLLLGLWPAFTVDPYALAAAVINQPELLDKIPQLRDPLRYAGADAFPLMMEAVGRDAEQRSKHWAALRDAIDPGHRNRRTGRVARHRMAQLLEAYGIGPGHVP
jgi:hypothetical protein